MDYREHGRIMLRGVTIYIGTRAPKHLLVEATMAEVELKKSVDELLDKIASDNAALFELLATNGKIRK